MDLRPNTGGQRNGPWVCDCTLGIGVYLVALLHSQLGGLIFQILLCNFTAWSFYWSGSPYLCSAYLLLFTSLQFVQDSAGWSRRPTQSRRPQRPRVQAVQAGPGEDSYGLVIQARPRVNHKLSRLFRAIFVQG